MKKAIKFYQLFNSFVKHLKNKGIYEFDLKQFVEFSQKDEQQIRRFLSVLVDLNEIKEDFYYKTNRKKYLIIK